MQDFVQSNMNNLLSCRYNMDTNRVEARFKDETTLAIDCIAVDPPGPSLANNWRFM